MKKKIEEMNLEEIEQRLIELDKEVRDMKTAEEVETATEEKRKLLKRKQELSELEQRKTNALALQNGSVIGVKIEKRGAAEMTEKVYDLSSVEYRSAWLKSVRSIELSEAETRAMTTAAASAGAVVPTTTANKIIEKVHQYAPLLDQIELLHVAGNVSIPAEGTTNDAAKHTEGAVITASADTMGKVNLSAYEVTKLITISKSVETMSIDAFESWLVNKLGRTIADKLTALIINGSGNGEAEGIDSITWTESNSVTVAKNATLTEANVLTVVGLLNGGYDAGAKWLMSKQTFFADFYPLMNRAKNITVDYVGGKYHVQGYEVEMDDRVTLHEAFLGNIMRGYVGNMAEDVNVTSQFVIRENSYDFLGAAMFDGKVQAVEAFVKIAKATE